MKCLSWIVLYSFDFSVYGLKYFEPTVVFTDSIANFLLNLLCRCIDMSKIERQENERKKKEEETGWTVGRKIAPSIYLVCHRFVWLRRHTFIHANVLQERL